MKKLFKETAGLFLFFAVLIFAGMSDAKTACAAGSSYVTVRGTQDETALRYTKAGNLNFGYRGRKIAVKNSKNKASTLVSAKAEITNVLTNGSKVYYQVGTKVYSVNKNGKNNKLVCNLGKRNQMSAYYNGSFYYNKTIKGVCDDSMALYRYSLKTKKSAKVFDAKYILQQNGTYATVRDNCSDPSPVALRVYNLKTGKTILLCKEGSGATVIGTNAYYAKVIQNAASGYNVRLQCYSIKTGKTTVIGEMENIEYVDYFTVNGCYYYDSTAEIEQFYNLKNN